MNLYMTAYGGAFLGPIAKVFGIIIDALYKFFEGIFGIGNVNIGLIIIIFTIIVYIILFPLTYQQQKFANLQKKIQPEVQAIQKKYKGKRDNASMMKQQEETQALYDKYGISMSGSCVQLLIQLPILYALFGVFNNLPAYLTSVRSIFSEMVSNIQATPGYEQKMQAIFEGMNNRRLQVDFLAEGLDKTALGNYIIDVAYKLSDSGWDTMRETFSSFSDVITTAQSNLSQVNYFFLLNISDTPMNIIKTGWTSKAYILIFAALLIPLCSYLSQVLSIKLSTMGSTGTDQMASQMQTMNRVMPLISLFFVFSVPIGLGLYWIASALFRSLNMFLLNKHFQKMDLDAIIEKNKERAEIKRKKRQTRNENIAAAATVNTKRTMSDKAKINNEATERLEAAKEARRNAKPGSMASKANLVADYNQKNSRK